MTAIFSLFFNHQRLSALLLAALFGSASHVLAADFTVANTYHWPTNGALNAVDDLWINTSATPDNSTTNAFVVYSVNGSTNWNTTVMSADDTVTSADGWHANLGKFPGGATIKYAICVQGASGDVWDNNNNNDFTATVNAGAASSVSWTPETPDNCLGSTVTVTYAPNSGALSAASAVTMIYGCFYATTTNWAGAPMTATGQNWTVTLSIPSDCLAIEICFTDGSGNWDNNTSSNWTITLAPCESDDTDGDGMQDEWESKYGFNPNSPSDASADTDGDGFSNHQEYVAGTNPTNALSSLALSHSLLENGSIRLLWPVADTGRRYTLYRSTNLTSGPFTLVQSNIVGALPQSGYTDTFTTNHPSVYYKLRAEIPSGGIVVESVTISASPAGGSFSDGDSNGIPVTLRVSGVNVSYATYAIQSGSPVFYTNGTVITFGADMNVGDYRTLTLYGETAGGITTQKMYTFSESTSATPVTWFGGSATDPTSGNWDAEETLTISFKTAPIGAAASAGIVYSSDGATWSSAALTKTGSNATNDLWSITLSAYPKGTTIRFAFVVTDAEGTQQWDNNNSANYSIRVNSDFEPGPDKPYSTNPTLGAFRSSGITIDGANTAGEWSDSMLIALDVANDDPRTLGSNWTTHEAPLDFSHLWACWDDNYLYVAWQLVDITDAIDGANAGSGDPISRNDGILLWMVLDTESGGATNDMWNKKQTWGGADQPDYMIYMAGSLWQGYISHQSGGVFPVDSGEYYACAARSITYDNGALLVPSILYGVSDCDNRNNGESALQNFLTSGHNNTSRDSFYEIKIPLASIGLTRATLEAGGIGVMLGAGSTSAMDTIPNDAATTDTPGVESYNSSFEWSDTDHYTAPFARIAAP